MAEPQYYYHLSYQDIGIVINAVFDTPEEAIEAAEKARDTLLADYEEIRFYRTEKVEF